jgi:adenylate cyclase
VVRWVPLILRLSEKPYPSLVAETLRVTLGASSYVGRAAGANAERSFGEKTGLTPIRIGQLTTPTDAAGRVWLHYAVPHRDRFVSVADIPAGKFDPTFFTDRIVLVGTSAAGIVSDLQATLVARGVPG